MVCPSHPSDETARPDVRRRAGLTIGPDPGLTVIISERRQLINLARLGPGPPRALKNAWQASDIAALIALLDPDATITVLAFDITGDHITPIWAVRNPDKLRPWTTS